MDQEFLCSILRVNVIVHFFFQQFMSFLPTLHGMVSMTLQSSDSPSLTDIFFTWAVCCTQATQYSLENCSRYIHLIFFIQIHAATCIFERMISQVSSHCLKLCNNMPKLKNVYLTIILRRRSVYCEYSLSLRGLIF